MKTVENLEGRELLITEARKIKGGKIQLTFAQKIENPHARPGSIAGLLNASDERFSKASNGVRYAWMSGTPGDIQASLGLDVSSLQNEGDKMVVNMLNPKIQGNALNIQITETTQGNEYEKANYETAAKRAGKDGEFILSKDGKYIFVRATVVAGEAQHVFIKDTVRPSQIVSEDADEAVASDIENEINS